MKVSTTLTCNKQADPRSGRWRVLARRWHCHSNRDYEPKLKERNSMRRPRPLILSLVVAAALALLAAGCGGGGSPGVAKLASPTTATTTTKTPNGAVAFATCMRSNGVPTFPDPGPKHAPAPDLSLTRLGVSGAQFDAASRSCAHLLPNGGQPAQADLTRVISDLLAFARCMRGRGIPFPDPTSQGDLNFAGTGINKSSPAFLTAARTCLPTAHGAIRIRPPGQ